MKERRRTRRCGPLLLVLAIATTTGCNDELLPPEPDLARSDDGAVTSDLTASVDSSPPVDLVASDLADAGVAPLDLASLEDLAVPPRPDLAGLDLQGLCQQAVGAPAPLPWQAQGTTRPTADLEATWASASDDAWFVGKGGALYHSVDGGVTLVREPLAFSSALHAIWGAAKGDLYVAGANGLLLHGNGKGAWLAHLTNTQAELHGLWGSGPGDLYAVGAGGVILHSPGNGQWTPQASGTRETLRAVFGSGPGDVWAVGTGGTLLHSTGNGMWSAQATGAANPPDLLAGWASGPADVYVAGTNGSIFHSTGMGRWTVQPTGFVSAVTALRGRAANDLFALTDAGQVLHSSGLGAWAREASLNVPLAGLFPVAGGTVFACGAFAFLATSPGGGAWTIRSNTAMLPDLAGITAADATNLYAAGTVPLSGDGAILFSDGIRGWVEVVGLVGRALTGVWAASPGNLYAFGSNGTVVRGSGRGPNWDVERTNTAVTLRAMWSSAANDLYAVGDSGTILHSTGNGQWVAQASGTNAHLLGIWGSAAGDLYVVGAQGTVLHSTGNGRWAAQASGTGLSLLAVGGRSACDVWAVGQGGIILRSDGGGAWVKVNANVFWTLAAVAATPTDVWIAGDGGTLLHSSGGAPVLEPPGTKAPLRGLAIAAGAVFAVGNAQTIQKGGP